MATTPEAKPVAPQLGELSPPESPFHPNTSATLKRQSARSAPFVDILLPEDTVLQSKGGIENLKVYKELLRDDQVSAAWGQRRLALTACDLMVEAGDESEQAKAAADALLAELKAINWDDITDKQLYAVFYGWSVAEIMWRPNAEQGRVSFDRIVVRDRARFRFDREHQLFLWVNAQGWVPMPDRKFWTTRYGSDNSDEPYGIGLANALYWPVFFKRNDIKFWLVFLEKFGMPTTLAKMPAGAIADSVQKAKAIEMLQLIATDAGVVVPDNIVVELLEAARTGKADYADMYDKMDKAISKILVGQTMTVDDGSSRAQAQVHAEVSQSIVEADSDLLCGGFNEGPVKWWMEWNYPGVAMPRVYRHTEPPEDLGARAERDSKIKALGYNPTEQYILETYGEGWEKAPEPKIDPMSGRPAKAGASFAEEEAAAIAALKAVRRADQDVLLEAATDFAEQYQTIMGRQVAQLLEAAEISEDPETFRRRLNELLEQGPTVEQVVPLARGNFFAKLMGAIRGQRTPTSMS